MDVYQVLLQQMQQRVQHVKMTLRVIKGFLLPIHVVKPVKYVVLKMGEQIRQIHVNQPLQPRMDVYQVLLQQMQQRVQHVKMTLRVIKGFLLPIHVVKPVKYVVLKMGE